MNADQLRAARALLDWTRKELADASGLASISIQRIEKGETQPHGATLATLESVFTEHGIEFVTGGARKRDDMIRTLEGPDAYMRLMDDIFHDTRDGSEVLWFCSDDRSPREGEIKTEERIRSSGSRFRCLVEAGNDVQRWPQDEYRQIPSEYFNHDLQVIYGNKVAQLIDGGKKILIIHNASLTQTERNKFNMLWPLLRPLKGKK